MTSRLPGAGMRRTLLLASLLAGLGAGPATAQPPSQAEPPARQASPPPEVDRVPENATNGAPGSANSPNPDANVPPVQTPEEPVNPKP